MLTKEQALAMADTLTAPADAKRNREVERRRQRRISLLPALRHVPFEDWAPVTQAASRYALRRWVLYIPLAVFMLWALQPLYAPRIFGVMPIRHEPMGLYVPALLATVLLQRRFMNAFIKRYAAQSGSGREVHE
jgi:hypothetical protein